MDKFETVVKELKFKVLKSIAEATYNNTDISEVLLNVPKEIIPGPKATMRCCIYKERAVVQERISLGLGGHANTENILEVIPVACDECPLGGYEVSNHCRGCIARNCIKACYKEAISVDPVTKHAFIDKSKCVNCGLCAKACTFSAIMNYQRPCESVCATHAISMGENGEAVVNDNKCVGCGHCIARCPFGAILDKSYIRPVIQDIQEKDSHVYAIVAPSFPGSFKNTNIRQMVTAVKKLGFYEVYETSLGADMVAEKETEELLKKGKITSSCCPSFVSYIKKELPEYKDYISETLSPMALLAEHIKGQDPLAKVVFIGPCTSKKYEIRTKHVGGRVNFVLTFEELQAMFAARNIEPNKEEETELKESSKYGRMFASTGGVSSAIQHRLKEIGSDFVVKPMVVSGIKNFKTALKTFIESDEYNFFEGMTCQGGCINGPCAVYHDVTTAGQLKKYIDEK